MMDILNKEKETQTQTQKPPWDRLKYDGYSQQRKTNTNKRSPTRLLPSSFLTADSFQKAHHE